jgi:hypothetical protein
MSDTRAFTVHAADEARRSHRVEGASFEDAAIAFVELWSPEPDAEGDVQIIVRDAETGAQHCFRIDLDSGEAAPCD